jgi:hypothetical protein
MKKATARIPICQACRQADDNVKRNQLIKIFQERYPDQLPCEVPEAFGFWLEVIYANESGRAKALH